MKAPFGPVGDPKADDLRNAIQWAADREEFNKLGFNGTGHLSLPYFIGWDWIYTKDQWLKEYKGFDSTPAVKKAALADAQALMTKHGYSKDNPLSPVRLRNRQQKGLRDLRPAVGEDLDRG